jgi:hypothetical protein
MRVRALLAAAVAAVGLAASAQGASVINFDPDGVGGDAAVKPITFDFSPGNSLNLGAVGGAPAWDLLFQAKLAALDDSAGNVITGLGLNSKYEITAVLRTTVVAINPPPALVFQQAPVQTVNFLEFWYDATPATFANDLAGTGFNDGTLILSANVSRLFGSFAVATTVPPQTFDQHGANNYPGLTTVMGAGGVSMQANVTSYDSTFFLNAPPSDIKLVFANASDILPFLAVDPSGLFAGLPGGVPPAVVPAIGPINGLSGPDIQIQSDANAQFIIPLPSAAWAGMSLLGLLGVARLRKAMR